MHSAILAKFPNSTINCCRFHLGQSWWRRIQAVGLSVEYGTLQVVKLKSSLDKQQ
jgi:hypothetical protein